MSLRRSPSYKDINHFLAHVVQSHLIIILPLNLAFGGQVVLIEERMAITSVFGDVGYRLVFSRTLIGVCVLLPFSNPIALVQSSSRDDNQGDNCVGVPHESENVEIKQPELVDHSPIDHAVVFEQLENGHDVSEAPNGKAYHRVDAFDNHKVFSSFDLS
jgi:hypothetical protein